MLIRIAYINFWVDPKNDSYLTQFISENIGSVELVRFNENPDLLIASCFGDINRVLHTRAKKKMFYYGENLINYPPYNNDQLLHRTFDLVVGFKSSKGHIRFPLWLIYYPYYNYNADDNVLKYVQAEYDRNMQTDKTIFATHVARHDRNGLRSLICNEVQKYGKVMYPGAFRNNTNRIGLSSKDKIDYISHSTFNICPENSSFEGYCTEKIFQAFEGGTIPLYWGIDSPEPGIIHTNKYCFYRGVDAIEHAITHPDEYTKGPLFTDDAPKMLSDFYQNLIEHIRVLI